nr:hypothetical protein [Acetobacter pasteurianus]
MRDYANGGITCPPRTVVPMQDGNGTLMCMPTVAEDLIATKILTIFGKNPALHLPTIQGMITCADAPGGFEKPFGSELFCVIPFLRR